MYSWYRSFASLASPRHFALAFRIFDLNGDGELDNSEFERVQELVMAQTTAGQRHRDHANTNCTFKQHVNTALATYFFGLRKDGKLTIDNFLKFQVGTKFGAIFFNSPSLKEYIGGGERAALLLEPNFHRQ